jgi:hypothetical protein
MIPITKIWKLDLSDNYTRIFARMDYWMCKYINLRDGNMRRITNVNELKVGSKYWLRDKEQTVLAKGQVQERKAIVSQFKARVDHPEVTYFEDDFWTHEGNNQGMKRWNIYGPLPTSPLPDFDRLDRES